MASSMRVLRHVYAALQKCNSQLTAVRQIHVSCVVAKQNDKPGSTDIRQPASPTGKSEKDELLGAAAKVAASMKGLEEEAFSDLSSQLDKLDVIVDKRKAASSIITPPERMAAVLTNTQANVPVLDEHAKTRIAKIKHIYRKQTADDEVKPNESTIGRIMQLANSSEPETDEADTPSAPGHQQRPRSFDDDRQRSGYDSENRPMRRSFDDDRQRSGYDSENRPMRRNEYRQRDGRRRRDSDLAGQMLKSVEAQDGTLYSSDLLVGVEPLNIFNPSKWTAANEGETLTMPQIWVEEKEKAIKEAQVFPCNGFEEMIRWTNEGKLWHYPIDNEQGLDEEMNTPFYEHVFLEKHLKSFPETGSVRTFMELVITGLSKNPHLSVREKVEHITWFEEYFRKKQRLVPSEPLLADPAISEATNTA